MSAFGSKADITRTSIWYPLLTQSGHCRKCIARAAFRDRADFRQINKEKVVAHHDALEFPDGQIVLLTSLSEGQQATVLQLPAEPKTVVESEAQRRADYVG